VSLERHPDRELIDEVIVVNNGLTLGEEDRTKLEAYEALPIRVIDNQQKSYASGVNRGAAAAAGEVLLIANNDIQWLPSSSIRPLIEYFDRNPRVGIAGPQLLYPDGRWQQSYGRFSSLLQAFVSLTLLDSVWHGIQKCLLTKNWLPKKVKRVQWVSGAFMAVRRECFTELDGFNTCFSFYGEDTDFCWRARQVGWEVVFVPTARIIHIGGASSLSEPSNATRLFEAKEKFLHEGFGPRKTFWYMKIMQLAVLERLFLYNLIGTLTSSAVWKRRAHLAKERLKAVSELLRKRRH